MTSTTTAPATSGIGCSHGIACQVSLPNMSAHRPWTNRCARASDIRAWTARKLLVHNRTEQACIDRAVGEGTYIVALLAKRGIAGSVQCRSGLARRGYPLRKGVLGYGMHREAHVGEAVAAELGGLAIKFAGLVGGEVQLRDHSIHGGDHAAELRHEEHVHDGSRGQREVHRYSGGNDELIDACNALIGVDEQPFPIERDDLHLDRFVWRGDRLVRIEIV